MPMEWGGWNGGPLPACRRPELSGNPNKKPTLADWLFVLNLLVVMGGVEPPTYGL